MRIFEAKPISPLQQHWFGFSGFLDMEVLLEWKSNEFQSACTKEFHYMAGEHMGIKNFDGATRLPVVDIN